VQVLKFDEGAQLLEFIEGPHLDILVDKGQDLEALQIICDIIKDLHSYAGPIPKELMSMQRNFQSLFKIAQDPAADPIFAKGAMVATKLIDSARDLKVLHGDLHHKNIMQSSSRGWLAIDPKCLYGESTYDLANIFFNPFSAPNLVATPERIKTCVKVFSRNFAIEPARILDYAFAYGCLSTAFCIEDGVNPDYRMRMTKLIESVIKGNA
jgi:streptomycin 6-kinase